MFVCFFNFKIFNSWGNLCLGLLPTFWLGCLFFWYWDAWAACIVWRLILCQLFQLLLFSPILGVCVFTLLIVFLHCAKAFKFSQVPLVYCCFYFHYSRRILLWFMSSNVLPMFSSKSFMFSGLTFRSLIHFWVYLCVWCSEVSNFILLHVAVQFYQHHLLKRLSLPHCIFLPPLSKIRYP